MSNDTSWKDKMDRYFDKESNPYIGKQYKTEYDSTKMLFSMITEKVSPDFNGTVLDAGCGDGAVLQSASKYLPQAHLSGIDISSNMLAYAQDHLPDTIELKQGSFFELGKHFEDSFDVVYSVHTLEFFDDFEEMVLSLMGRAKQYVFINALFSRHNVDMRVTVREQGRPEVDWNIFSMDRFRDFVLANGASSLEFREVELSVDLPDPGTGMSSYTRRLADNQKLTFSGPLYLPWYLVCIQMN